jgi:RNA recognition motif-containing protein
MKINVSNLDPSTAKDDLYDLFGEFGEVKNVIILPSLYGNVLSKLATVEMHDELSALEAIEELNGEWFDGRYIRVTAAQKNIPEDGTPQAWITDETEEKWLDDFWERTNSQFLKKIRRQKPSDPDWSEANRFQDSSDWDEENN